MITRGDLIWLGVASGVCGGLIGGLLLGLGVDLLVNRAMFGFLLVLPAAPASCIAGYFMARRLARQLP
jgi:hypothetical protein